MSALALLLIAIGLADLVSTRGWHDARRGQRVGVLTGLASIAALAILADLDSWGDLALLAVAGATTAAWVVLVGRTMETDRGHGVALAALTAGIALTVLLSGWSSAVGGAVEDWMAWTGIGALAAADPTRALLLVGLFLLQRSTGNLIVRLALVHTGAMNPLGDPQPSDRLRGGRLLGPMERVFILGLGLTGQVTAASIVIAAKGLIRWPELQRASRDSEREEAADSRRRAASIDQITEYFLIGSFVSWLIALAALVVAHLA